jgi:formate dehydrogenase subunit delta
MFSRNDPDRAAAVDAVANHIQRSWDPRMRPQISVQVAAGGEGLGEIARDAVKALPPISARWKAHLPPRTESSAA